MGDYADAVIECFGSDLHQRLEDLCDPYTYIYEERPEYAIVAIEQLGYGEEGLLCERLQQLAIGYAFFHCGDHEHSSRTRLYMPGLDEWHGEADADGGVLVRAGVLDRLANRARARGLFEVADEIDQTSARALREFVAERHGVPTPPAKASARTVDDLRQMLAENPAFTYVRADERYLVVLAVTYGHESDPTDTGERIASARDAGHWALELTRDGGSPDTQWTVFDAVTGVWTIFEQSDIEEA
jgi:hypothetical protein